jgi:hypothetical protein
MRKRSADAQVLADAESLMSTPRCRGHGPDRVAVLPIAARRMERLPSLSNFPIFWGGASGGVPEYSRGRVPTPARLSSWLRPDGLAAVQQAHVIEEIVAPLRGWKRSSACFPCASPLVLARKSASTHS